MMPQEQIPHHALISVPTEAARMPVPCGVGARPLCSGEEAQKMDPATAQPGPIVVFGSGETAAGAQPVYDLVLRALPPPVRVAILETPAGFELNSDRVAGRVADYLAHHLQNYQPHIQVVPARGRGTALSPDDPDVIAPLWHSNVIYLGAGSPSYAVQQLRASLAWQSLRARHLCGAVVIMASAAALAASSLTLPVYEIYKVGQPPKWIPGLDLLAPFGLSIVFVPHWNNNDGGEELDTRYAFMGERRFAALRAEIEPGQTMVGIDENTALAIDLAAGCCRVLGAGQVRVIRGPDETIHAAGDVFPLERLGAVRRPTGHEVAAPAVWRQLWAARAQPATVAAPAVPPEVAVLVAAREAARQARDWRRADRLRQEIAALGWQVQDTPAGPLVSPTAAPIEPDSRPR
jgi:cyanophycinase-like exopeptidase